MIFFPTFIVPFFLILSSFIPSIYAQKDLEESIQDFVIETKKIGIPKCPHAFNPSIIKWRGDWLMSFRFINEIEELSSDFPGKSGVGLIRLDEELNPVGDPQFILLDPLNGEGHFFVGEDVRLITKNNHLYMIYSVPEEGKKVEGESGGFRVCVAEVNNNEDCFYLIQNECFLDFEGKDPGKPEKNWVPFVYEDELLLMYHFFPHKIFRPLLNGTGACETISKNTPSFVWEWGELRGGTPAFPINQEYHLGIFHSSMPLSTLHSKNKVVPHYFMGAYLFSSTPPFEIKYISPEPIIGPNFYKGLNYEPYWHPVQVVFPCGLVIDEKQVWVTYGRQDHEIWVARFDKKQLVESLIHVSSFITKEDESLSN